ncbi:MAG TPA: hypothetical protein VF773_19070 [Verrucomicrobiae bacterium]
MKLSLRHARSNRGFTRIDAGAILAVCSLLLLLVWPVLASNQIASNQIASTGISCLGNIGQLTRAWQLYAADNNEELVGNFRFQETGQTISAGTFLNWTHNNMDWSTNPSNTNRTLMARSRLFPYLQNTNSPFKCPADQFLSSIQRNAGWTSRLRSYSMNGFLGPNAAATNDVSYRGENWMVPGYRQFIKTSAIPSPARTYVLIDEHQESINDGYFITDPTRISWVDVPGPFHNGGSGISFADGHAEIHVWLSPVVDPFRPPTAGQRTDQLWLAERTTVRHNVMAVRKAASGAKVVWSPSTSNHRLQSNTDLETTEWTAVTDAPVKGYGQVEVTTANEASAKYFRLVTP